MNAIIGEPTGNVKAFCHRILSRKIFADFWLMVYNHLGMEKSKGVDDMLIIGVCGASGSGKSTLADELCKAIGTGCTVINHDSYYLDHPDLTFNERSILNYDEPSIFDHDLFLADIQSLLKGTPITTKHYDYDQHKRADKQDLIYSTDVLIVEGIHVFMTSAFVG